MITLATAHPAKFPEAVKAAAGVEPQLPAGFADLLDRPERFTVVANDAEARSRHSSRITSAAVPRKGLSCMTVRVSRLPTGLTVVTHDMDHLESAALGVWVGAGSRSERDERARPLAPPRAHGVQGHRARARPPTSPRRSRRSAARSTPRPASRRPPTTRACSRTTCRSPSTSSATSSAIRASTRRSWSASSMSSCRRSARRSTRRRTASTTCSPRRPFPDQPIGRTILGTAETVRGVGSPMLDAYLHRHYRGPSMVLAAAGAVDHDKIVALAERALRRRSASSAGAGAGAGRLSRRRRARDARPHGKRRSCSASRACLTASDDFHTAQILASIVGGGMSSRLFQEIREKRGLCYSIYAFHWSFADTGIFGVHTATGPDDVGKLMPVLLMRKPRFGPGLAPSSPARRCRTGPRRPSGRPIRTVAQTVAEEVPFSSELRWSAVRIAAASSRGALVLGAPEVLRPRLLDGDGDGDARQRSSPVGPSQGLRVVVFARRRGGRPRCSAPMRCRRLPRRPRADGRAGAPGAGRGPTPEPHWRASPTPASASS